MDIKIDTMDQWLLGEQQTRLNQYEGPLDVCVDVGAHVGTFSLCAADRGAKKVYAFEPNPENYANLVRNIEVNKFRDVIIPFQSAVVGNSTTKRATLRRAGSNNGQYSIMYKDLYQGAEVDAMDLWDFIVHEIPGKVDYLKIDIEGGEWDLFEAPEAAMALSKVGYVDIETHPLDNPDYFDRPAEWKGVEWLPGILRAAGFQVIGLGWPPIWRGGKA